MKNFEKKYSKNGRKILKKIIKKDGLYKFKSFYDYLCVSNEILNKPEDEKQKLQELLSNTDHSVAKDFTRSDNEEFNWLKPFGGVLKDQKDDIYK